MVQGGGGGTSPLAALHRAAGATLGDFAGWELPLWFTSAVAEHHAVRERAGMFDVSHLGTVWVAGPGATATIAASFTNDPARVGDGAAQYTLCCDDRGGVLDDLIVYRLAADRWLCIPNAANTATVVGQLAGGAERAGVDGGVEVRDESTAWGVVAVQGPASLELVDDVLSRSSPAASALAPFGVVEVELAGGAGGALMARTGYTGEAGVEFVARAELAPTLWAVLADAGAEPCGLAARDSLRLECGFPLHGAELTPEVTPYDAGLGWAVRFGHGKFPGEAALRALAENGAPRRSWGLVVDSRRPPRAGMRVLHDGSPVGRVTSGGYAPTLGAGVALAALEPPIRPGDRVDIDLRGHPVSARVVAPPFVDRGSSAVTPP